MKSLVIISSLFALTLASTAEAKPKNFGVGLDYTFLDGLPLGLGIQDGIALGAIVKPNVPWFRFELAGTYNAIGPGFRTGMTLDSINFFISPSLTLEAGHSFPGTLNGARLESTYINIRPGIEVGNQNNIRFFVRGGPSYLWLYGNQMEGLFGYGQEIMLTNTHVNGWIFPTVNGGVNVFF